MEPKHHVAQAHDQKMPHHVDTNRVTKTQFFFRDLTFTDDVSQTHFKELNPITGGYDIFHSLILSLKGSTTSLR